MFTENIPGERLFGKALFMNMECNSSETEERTGSYLIRVTIPAMPCIPEPGGLKINMR